MNEVRLVHMLQNGKQYFRSGKLIRFVIDNYDIHITSETITVEGYKKWIAVTRMTANEDRILCIDWVLSLIEKGILKKELCDGTV